MRPVAVVANVLVSGQGEVLLGLRGDLLQWEVPGGKVEDETLAEAGRREQEEETGMLLRGTPSCLGYADVVLRGVRYLVVFLAWREWEGFPRLREENTLRWRWFAADALPAAKDMTPGTRKLFGELSPFPAQGAAARGGEHSGVERGVT